MMPAAVAGQVLALTPIGGFQLSTLIFGGAVTGDVVLSIVLNAILWPGPTFVINSPPGTQV